MELQILNERIEEVSNDLDIKNFLLGRPVNFHQVKKIEYH